MPSDPLEDRANALANFLIDSNRKALRGCTYNRNTAATLARAVAWYMAAKDLSFNEASRPVVEASAQWRELDTFLYKVDAKAKRGPADNLGVFRERRLNDGPN